jgi:SNF2 family DNA or RNA helicase
MFFDAGTRTWRLPLSVPADNLKALLRFAEQFDFDVNDSARERVEQRISDAVEAVHASHAADADIHVAGLAGELLPFQKAAVAYSVRAHRVLIGDEMGLGKTVEALAIIKAANAFPALVVCPATLKLNWRREAEKWLPIKRVAVLGGQNGTTEGDIVIINYDVLGRFAAKLKTRGFKGIIFDESHYAKNHKAQRTAHCKQLASGIPVRLCLTGTPVLNRPAELISQLQLLDRLDDLGGFWNFAERYCDAHKNRWGWDFSGASNLDELNERLRATCYIRRTKAEVLPELPAKRRCIVPVEIDNLNEYKRAERDLLGWIREKSVEDDRFLESIDDLPVTEQLVQRRERSNSAVQRAAHAEQLVRIEALKQLAARGKIAAATEWITSFIESGEKLIVFAHHQEIQDELLVLFPSAAVVRGGDDVLIRQANVDRFQTDANCRLIVCSLRAGGVGITLTAASNVCFLELGWTPAEHDQAEDRCHRIGQKESVRPGTSWQTAHSKARSQRLSRRNDPS